MSHLDRLFAPHLIRDFRNYIGPVTASKAVRVHRKCLLAGKFELAKRIKLAYPMAWPVRTYDIVDAMGITLFELKNLGK
jgi:hypothetical protein